MWYLDSGSSRHMTSNRELLQDVKQVNGGVVTFTGDKGGKITGEGKVCNETITLARVKYVE
jgi:hypothetical protein